MLPAPPLEKLPLPVMQLAGLRTMPSLPRPPLNTLQVPLFVTTHSLTNTIPSLHQLCENPMNL